MKQKITLRLLLILLGALVLDLFLSQQLLVQYNNDQKVDVSLRLAALRARLEKEITANLLLVQGVANYISVTPSLDQEQFAQYAETVLQGTSLIKNLGAAPDFVMRYVYPLAGNEAVIGVDYRKLPEQWAQVKYVERTGQMVVAGPLELIQGGTGIVGRAPVFVTRDGQRSFWGVVSSVIDAEQLFHAVGLDETNLTLAIRGVDGLGERGGVFLGSDSLFAPEAEAVLMPVTFPSGSWVIAGLPEKGWARTHPLTPLVHGLLALLALVSGLAAYRASRRNHEIAQARASLDQAQRIAHLGSWEANLETGALWWSDETYRIFGLERGSLQPTLEGFLTRVHPDDRPQVEREYTRSLQTCASYAVDHRIVLSDGTVRHVQERGQTLCSPTGKPLRSTGTILDITDRKLAEAALKAGEEKMRAMAEASHDALIMIDAEDRILFWSDAAERMFGWSREEVLGRAMHPLITQEEDQVQARVGLEHFAQTGQGPVIGSVMEFTAVKRDGELFPVERSVAAFRLGETYYAVGSLRDITLRKKAEEELRNFSHRLTLASRAGGIGVWEWNLKDNTLIWDDLMFELYQVRANEFSGVFEAWRSRVHPEDLQAAEASIQAAAHSAESWDWEFRIVWPDGQVRCIKAAARTQKDEQQRPLYMIGVNWDVTEARNAQEKLRLLATTDSLTGIFNRRHFLEVTERELERCRRYPAPFSLIMFDADRFKAVNDTHGHDVGDLVLKVITRTAAATLRDVDILGRIGGEEFAVGLPQTDLDGALLVAERLRQAIAQVEVPLAAGGAVRFTISLGVATYSETCNALEDLLKAADVALYRAKQNGRNRVEATSNTV